jgi:DNA-binding NtrC family response regulator
LPGAVIYINTMKTNVLVADNDMDVHQLVCDVLEICLRNVKVERAMSLQGFWAKLPAQPEQPWHVVFLSAEYIKEEPDGFADRLTAVNPNVIGKVVILGAEADAELCGEGGLMAAPLLVKPFSLDRFEELVKQVCGS